MLLIDTNVWIHLMKNRSPLLTAKWRSVAQADIAVCSVVKGELWLGAHKHVNSAKRLETVNFWLAPYDSLPFDDTAAHFYASIRHHLETRGEVIGPNDMKIASICLAYDLTLVTGNIDEFRRVPGLRVEDWSQA